ncbi:MAG: hypothetical protein JSS66_06935 [Armatimonadetes bacterium]|nr:hypothetical protein [Armatimonadota bacterium]
MYQRLVYDAEIVDDSFERIIIDHPTGPVECFVKNLLMTLRDLEWETAWVQVRDPETLQRYCQRGYTCSGGSWPLVSMTGCLPTIGQKVELHWTENEPKNQMDSYLD